LLVPAGLDRIGLRHRDGLRPGDAESERHDVSDRSFLILLIFLFALALGVGIWVGLGYPGLYGRYEKTGRVRREPPFEQLLDWIVGKFLR
jgi:hypothetical protein